MEKKYEYFVKLSNDSGVIQHSIVECTDYYMTEDENFINFVSLDDEQFYSYNKKFVVSYGKRISTYVEPKELDSPF